jgi:hypothetical protein
MDLQTIVPMSTSECVISYDAKIVLLGSCFSENIGEKFQWYKFQSMNNPFGIMYHPLAIENICRRAINDEWFTESDVFYHQSLWHSFEVHSVMNHPDRDVFLELLNDALKTFKKTLSQASHLIITYGTAWGYEHFESQMLVANCHKVPQNYFSKKLLTVRQIEQSIANTIALLQTFQPNLKLLFTIAPVRHLKDGFVNNQISKAHLITALHQVIADKIQVFYFPSYEIMMDELRDYRYYATDMIHPSSLAIDYIWEKFMQTHMDAATRQWMKKIEKIQMGLQHRPFNPDTEAHLKFKEDLNQKIKEAQMALPFVTFE